MNESRMCFSCSAQVDAEDKFCQECGIKLEQPVADNEVALTQPMPSVPVSHTVPELAQFRSDWSVDFADVEPHTALGEGGGVEDTLELPESKTQEHATVEEVQMAVSQATASAQTPEPVLQPAPQKDIKLPFAKPGQVIFKNGELILIDTPEGAAESGAGLHSPLLTPEAILNVVRVKHAGQAVIDKRANKKVKRGFKFAVGHEPMILSMMLMYALGLLMWIHTEHPEVVYVQADATQRQPQPQENNSVAEYNKLLADYFARKTNSSVVEGQQIAQRQLTGEEPAPEPPSYDEWVNKNRPVF